MNSLTPSLKIQSVPTAQTAEKSSLPLACRAMNFLSDGECLTPKVGDAIIGEINRGDSAQTLVTIFRNALDYNYQDKLSELIKKECGDFSPDEKLLAALLEAGVVLKKCDDGSFSITQAPSEDLVDSEISETTSGVLTTLSIPSVLSKIIYEKADLTQNEKIGKFLGTDVSNDSDAEISRKLINSFRTRKAYPEGTQLILKNVKFSVPHGGNCNVPTCVKLVDCSLSLGNMAFSKGKLTATTDQAIAISTGPDAIAVSTAKKGLAIAENGGTAIADGEGAMASASGRLSTAIARTASSTARAHVRAKAFAQAEGACAIAVDYGAQAEATVAGSTAIAQEGFGLVAIARSVGAVANACGSYATAVAYDGAKAYAQNSSAVAKAHGTSLAYAITSGAKAQAYDLSTAHAQAPGAVAEKHSLSAQVIASGGGVTRDVSVKQVEETISDEALVLSTTSPSTSSLASKSA